MAYDLVTGQRTFCLGLSGLGTIDETETMDVPFVDSGGNLIKCNYISIKSTSKISGLNGGVLVELSGVSHVGDAITNELSALSATPATSGVCGFALPVAYLTEGTGEWHGSNGQVATGVRLIISANFTEEINLAITYGNLFPLNSLRLEQSYDAGV